MRVYVVLVSHLDDPRTVSAAFASPEDAEDYAATIRNSDYEVVVEEVWVQGLTTNNGVE
jgi:hypothetical protein